LGIALAVFAVAGAISDLAEKLQLFRAPFAVSLRRAGGLPRSTWGTTFAHAGIGIALMGIVCETTWNSEHIAAMRPGDSAKVAGYDLQFASLKERQGPNYRELVAAFKVSLDGADLGVMTPSTRTFTTRGTSTSEAALRSRGASQLYISL